MQEFTTIPPNSIPNLGVPGLFGPTLWCSHFDILGVLCTDDAVGENLVNWANNNGVPTLGSNLLIYFVAVKSILQFSWIRILNKITTLFTTKEHLADYQLFSIQEAVGRVPREIDTMPMGNREDKSIQKLVLQMPFVLAELVPW